jgi:transcriptional regulator with XRE-family HTH domain
MKDLAAALGVSIVRISQIEHGDVTSFEVIAGTSKHLADGWTYSPTSATAPSGSLSATPPTPPDDHCIPTANWQLRSHPYATPLHGARHDDQDFVYCAGLLRV